MIWKWIRLLSMKIKDNEPCPCGSGKNYMECCKGKQAKISTSPKPPEIQMAYTYYVNLQGKDALVMGKGIGFGLLNTSRDKKGKAYENSPKINLFANIEQK